jgi:ABC-type polar amino acid transport system ATPase subunit
MLRATGITKRFGTQEVLRGIDLTVEPGTITAIIGPSGGGKSTLLRALSLLEPPDTGMVAIDDEVHRFPNNGHTLLGQPWPKVGIVFQQLFLWPHLTLRKNITLPLELRGAPAGLGRVEHLIDVFELAGAVDKYPNQTSLGQRQRAALIRALVLEPRYLLLDEITSALDVEHVVRVLGQLREARAQGTGILLVTHLIGFARSSADQVVFIDGGQVLEAGGASILSKPKTERLARFLSLVETAV